MFNNQGNSPTKNLSKHKPEYKLSPKPWYLEEQPKRPHIHTKNSNIMRERVSIRVPVTTNEEYIRKNAPARKIRLKPVSQRALLSKHIGEERRNYQHRSIAQRASGYRFKAGKPGLTAKSGVSAYADKKRPRIWGKQNRQFALILVLGFVIITAMISVILLPGGESLTANKNQAISTPYADATDALTIPAAAPTPAPASETTDTVTP